MTLPVGTQLSTAAALSDIRALRRGLVHAPAPANEERGTSACKLCVVEFS